MNRVALVLLLMALSLSGVQAQDQAPGGKPKEGGPPPDLKLARQALEILKKNCFACHGPGGLNEGGFGYIHDRKKLIEKKKLVPGDLAASAKRGIWKVLVNKEMPPEEEKQRPSAKEIEIIGEWIKAGAPFPDDGGGTGRPFIGLKETLGALHAFLQKVPREDRKYIRYYSFANLHHDKRVSDADLRLYRAALAKVLNSLSWKAAIVVPEPIDQYETLYAFDLRKLDWDRHDLWSDLLSRYPYGLTFDRHPDEQIQELARQVYELSGTSLPWVRADWFVANASKPPLYHALLRLPKTATELEKTLKVDVQANFLRDQLWRAGFTKSGVSGQNRLLERHESAYGAYWKSYDFKTNEGRGNLFRYPLGPKFKYHPYPDAAFEHDGGEIIFNLPNGLQGYLLVDGKDNRIDEGPIEVVRDTSQTSGTPKIVNGLSCMNCHNKGMIDFTDTVRDGIALLGDPRDKVRRLFPTPDRMKRMVDEDTERFVQAYERAAGRFLKVGEDKDRDITSFKEPVGVLARRYILEELDVNAAATELGIPDPNRLQAVIGANDRLRELGLGPLARGNSIKREAWESMARGMSAYQEAANALELGTPRVIHRKLKN